MTAPPGDAAGRLAEAEAALTGGRPEEALVALARVPESAVPDALLPRWLDVLQRANRFLSRHRDTVAWIERRLERGATGPTRVLLLRTRIAALRQVDPRAALELVDEALEAARADKDELTLANVLSHAAFCAYRRGDARLAAQYAWQAEQQAFVAPQAQIDGLRAQMFAATAGGSIERALQLSTELRDRQLAVGDLAGAANERNNTAEEYLHLGRPADAAAEAREAVALATRAGHRAVLRFGEVLQAQAAAEEGRLSVAIEALRAANERCNDDNLIFAIDTAAALAFWLIERREPGDAEAAMAVVDSGIQRARSAHVTHQLTKLLATRARALALLGRTDEARASLAEARGAADAADGESELHLALTMAEVLPAGEPTREVALRAARTRLLLAAARREDPRRFAGNVRLHRRLLELSGGVPTDLPDAR